MAHTFANLLTHLIFSTKDRLPSIRPAFRADLWAYLGGIARGLQGQALIVGGTADHAHLLVWLPPTLAVSDCLRDLKANASRWVNETRGPQSQFAWQMGYGAFSVSQSNVPGVVKYIQRQEEHHRRVTFQEEFLAFLKKNNVAYDPRYIWE
jgi:REP element-mobilizing transposase RayT